MIVNTNSIKAKIDKYVNSKTFQKKVNEKIDEYMLNGKGGANTAVPPMSKIANEFINEMQSQIRDSASLGNTAVQALTDLKHGKAKRIGNGIYSIDIWFDGDLHRPSLYPEKYDGVDNIATLLNYGYSARHTVYGIWQGHGDSIRKSLQEREGAHFIERAISDFYSTHKNDYGIINLNVLINQK